MPRRSPWLVRLFLRYLRRYLGRNFHAVRLARANWPVDPGPGPLVVVMNHPSWWDPLVALLLTELFSDRGHYGPIDAAALGKYRFFERFGMFPVEQGTRAGALHFLRCSQAVLAQTNNAVWITAQGRFTDPRQRPLQLRAGVGHLVQRLRGGIILPLALEYPFWEERYPEVLARFGAPIPIGDGCDLSVDEWMTRIESALTAALDALAIDAKRRDASVFETLIGGNAGVGGVYDLWRRFKAMLTGKSFERAHSPVDLRSALGGSL